MTLYSWELKKYLDEVSSPDNLTAYQSVRKYIIWKHGVDTFQQGVPEYYKWWARLHYNCALY